MTTQLKKQTTFRRELYQRAMLDSFVKLDPRRMVRNPVMFVVEVGSLLTTVLWIQALFGKGEAPAGFIGGVALWLWFTVLFANFSEAVAEGRGKAQAEALRKTRQTTQAKKLPRPDRQAKYELVASTALRKNDLFLVEAGDILPVDGEIVEGIASVDESAVTGESAPVIRESGGDRSAVTGGTRLLSDWLVVRVTADPGEGFLDRMISLVEGAKRQKTPNEIALNILLAGFTIIFLIVCATLLPYSLYSVQTAGQGIAHHHHGAGGPAGLPDPDHHRRAALGHRHRRHGPHDPAQRHRHVGPGGGSRRGCGRAAARQDRHDHPGQPPGGRTHPGRGRPAAGAGRSRPTGLPGRRDPRRPLDRRAGQGKVRPARPDHGPQLKRPRRGCTSSRSPPRRACRVWTSTARPSARVRRIRCTTWSRQNGKPVPDDLKTTVERIARSGGTPLVVVRNGEALGVVHLKDIVKGGIKERFAQLRKMGIKTVMITGDNPLTAAAIAAEAGVDDFLAQATPEAKLKLIRDSQAGGRLVAMTGDGTNDAPALAQADVAVAMNTGTQPAREAANMVDLDSNPTKLIEIVEIGKQLLMTRGALTTFSIANDVSKYFAIIPAAFASTYPALGVLNIMRLATPQSAILSAVIFNALIIIALIPLALKGVPYRAVGAARLLRDNLLIYGLGGLIAPFIGIKLIDLLLVALHLV